ncbi:MAG: phosphoserine phosphatase SerB [Pseudomonadota bacterium]
MSVTLSRDLLQAEIATLLESLLTAEAVLFDPRGDVLHCQVDPIAMDEFEAALAKGLRGVGVAWDSHDATEPLGALYERADYVLTVQLAVDADFPPVAALLPEWDLEIRALRRLSPLSKEDLAFEVYFSGPDHFVDYRERLPMLSERWRVDMNLTAADSKRPRPRLFVFDMDSTLISCEVIDELAARAGVGDEVAAITARAMRGELDFKSSFRERMAKLRGLSAAVLDDIAAELPIMPGAPELMKTLRAQGHHMVILSGGFDYFAERVRRELDMHEVHANRLLVEDAELTGEVLEPIVDGERKVALLETLAREYGIELADTVAVGDGANDIPMLNRAGMGVAYHAKPLVREQTACAVNFADLTGLLYLLGVPRGS